MALVKTKEVERRENNNFLVARKGTKRKRKLLLLCSRQKKISFVLRLGRKIENFTPATKLGHEFSPREDKFGKFSNRSMPSRSDREQTMLRRRRAV